MSNKKLTVQQIQVLNNLLNKLSVKQLSVDTIQGVMGLQEELGKKVEEFQQTQEKILKSYKVEQVEGNFNWTEHKDKDEITQKVGELVSKPIEIEKESLNFAEEREVIESAKEANIPLGEMAVLIDMLGKTK